MEMTPEEFVSKIWDLSVEFDNACNTYFSQSSWQWYSCKDVSRYIGNTMKCLGEEDVIGCLIGSLRNVTFECSKLTEFVSSLMDIYKSYAEVVEDYIKSICGGKDGFGRAELRTEQD
ncbi:MAG: hypothetical protein DRO14_00375 [Thermoprotei archaeon]|nr:MAG: hypothetical protein DRO14_00060 [Thermoprotei archaeon]RLG78604.1 MAG: hypothetical protein DRO14_00375 [Thermoprotei archaeon]